MTLGGIRARAVVSSRVPVPLPWCAGSTNNSSQEIVEIGQKAAAALDMKASLGLLEEGLSRQAGLMPTQALSPPSRPRAPPHSSSPQILGSTGTGTSSRDWHVRRALPQPASGRHGRKRLPYWLLSAACGPLPACRGAGCANFPRHAAQRASYRAAGEFRAGYQCENCQGTRPDDPAFDAWARRRGDRMRWRNFLALVGGARGFL